MKWKELFDRLDGSTIKAIVADLKSHDDLSLELRAILEKADNYLKVATDEREIELLINKRKKDIRCLMQQIKGKKTS